MKLSIIIPVYNEEENITLVYKKIKDLFENINYEIIFINDGSTDKTYKVLQNIYKNDKKHIKVIDFSKNFGKDAAIYAGIQKASGEFTAIIDSLNQNPKYLLEMISFLENHNDYDNVAMIIKEQKSTSITNKILNKFINTNNDTNFRMFRENIKKAILSIKEKDRYSKKIFSWVGFKTKYIPYKIENKTKEKVSIKNKINYILEEIIINSYKPLKISTTLGILLSSISIIYFIYIIINFMINGSDTFGIEIILSLILFALGIQLISIGILGQYISKIFIESKNRPIYIENKSLGFDDDTLL